MPRRRFPSRPAAAWTLLGSIATFVALVAWWNVDAEKHLRIVDPGRLIGGAWQHPGALRRIIAREGIKTIVTLTAINTDDPKYVGQRKVVAEAGVKWFLIPMRGSKATIDQMVEAADLLADPRLQPVFFHCVGGHHRTSLAHAAYLVRHRGYSASEAWRVVASLPWARPNAAADKNDHALIFEFAKLERDFPCAGPPLASEVQDDKSLAPRANLPVVPPRGRTSLDPDRALRHLEPGALQLRGGPARTNLSLRPDARPSA